MTANKSKTQQKTYEELQNELAATMAWFESNEFDIDLAPVKYEQARQLIEALEMKLKAAENSVEKIKRRFDGA